MKDKIQIRADEGHIHFYLVIRNKRHYLFTQRYSKGVFEFFNRGRTEQEIFGSRQWKRNPRLDKTIEKIPLYTSYVRKELALA